MGKSKNKLEPLLDNGGNQNDNKSNSENSQSSSSTGDNSNKSHDYFSKITLTNEKKNSKHLKLTHQTTSASTSKQTTRSFSPSSLTSSLSTPQRFGRGPSAAVNNINTNKHHQQRPATTTLDENRNPSYDEIHHLHHRSSSALSLNMARSTNHQPPSTANKNTTPANIESQCLRTKARRLIVERFMEHYDMQLFVLEQIVVPLKRFIVQKLRQNRHHQMMVEWNKKTLESILIPNIFGNLQSLCDLYKRLTKQLLMTSITATSNTTKPKPSNDDASSTTFEFFIVELFCGKYSADLQYETSIFWLNQHNGQWYDHLSQLYDIISITNGADADADEDKNEDAKWRRSLIKPSTTTIATSTNNITQQNDVNEEQHCTNNKRLPQQQRQQQRWQHYSLQQLLETIAMQTVEYPPLLDRLLQETPLQSNDYERIEKALAGARNIAKATSDLPVNNGVRSDFDKIKISKKLKSSKAQNRGHQSSSFNAKHKLFGDLRSRLCAFFSRA